METIDLIASVSIAIAGITIGLGSIGPALAEGRALARAMDAIAQQPDEANTLTRTLFVGMAMIESTAIYCLVISLILLFANPFWNHILQSGG
ncbi:MAG: F0F1 ATP synthase subunit C [Gemmatimonadota bacterium]